MYRVGIIKKDGKVISKNFSNKEEAEEYILLIAEKEGIKQARIRDMETKKEERIEL